MKVLLPQAVLAFCLANGRKLPALQAHRSLPILNDACEQSFVHCAGDEQCMQCLSEIFDEDMDLYELAPETSDQQSCDAIFTALDDAGVCDNLVAANSKELFCTQFLDCVNEGEYDDDEETDPAGEIDCSTLTECEWNGFREEFIGDGVCDHWTAGGEFELVCF